MPDVVLTNFIPKRREISDVSLALQAVITTTEDHGYSVGLLVRLFVPAEYGMYIPYKKALIVDIPADNQITVSYDTSVQAAFLEPTAPPGFTQAQVIPIDGPFSNDTSITG